MPLDTRLELEKLESERKTIINSLAKLESQIYDFEGSYLKETGAYGNAVKVTTALLITTISDFLGLVSSRVRKI